MSNSKIEYSQLIEYYANHAYLKGLTGFGGISAGKLVKDPELMKICKDGIDTVEPRLSYFAPNTSNTKELQIGSVELGFNSYSWYSVKTFPPVFGINMDYSLRVSDEPSPVPKNVNQHFKNIFMNGNKMQLKVTMFDEVSKKLCVFREKVCNSPEEGEFENEYDIFFKAAAFCMFKMNHVFIRDMLFLEGLSE